MAPTPPLIKGLFDWASRIEPKVFQGKPALLLSTLPGPGGASSVLAAATATASAPYQGIELKGSFSLTSFYDNFDMEKQCISDATLDASLHGVVSLLSE